MASGRLTLARAAGKPNFRKPVATQRNGDTDDELLRKGQTSSPVFGRTPWVKGSLLEDREWRIRVRQAMLGWQTGVLRRGGGERRRAQWERGPLASLEAFPEAVAGETSASSLA